MIVEKIHYARGNLRHHNLLAITLTSDPFTSIL